MKLKQLTIEQIKNVERVIYQDTYDFSDCDLFEFTFHSLVEGWEDDPDIRLYDDGRLLKIDGDLIHFFENKISQRQLNEYRAMRWKELPTKR